MTKTRPPKYSIDKGKKKAFVRINGQKNYLPGQSNSPESREAYARFEIEWWQNSRRPVGERVPITPVATGAKTDTTVKEVALAYLQYQERRMDVKDFGHVRILVMDFLLAFYGDSPADSFTPRCIKLNFCNIVFGIVQ